MRQAELGRDGTYWLAVWYDQQNRRRKRCLGRIDTISRKQALQQLELVRDEHRAAPGRMLDPRQSPTLAQWQDIYPTRRPDLGDATLVLHMGTFARLVEHFGPDTRLDTITRTAAAGWRSWLATLPGKSGGTMADATVCGHCRAAKTIVKYAAREDLVTFNAFDQLRGTAPPVDKTARHMITPDEARRLIDAAPSTHWRCLIALCYFAGLRRSEALRMTWADIDHDGNRLTVRNPGRHVTTKHRTRVCRMEPELAAILNEACDAAQPGSRGPATHTPRSSLHRQMVAIVKAAGLGAYPRPFHSLRDARAELWAAAYPSHVCTAWLGNSEAVRAAHYLNVGEEHYGSQSPQQRIAELERELDQLRQTKRRLFTIHNSNIRNLSSCVADAYEMSQKSVSCRNIESTLNVH